MDVFDLQAKISLDSSGFEKNLNAAAGHMSGFGSMVEGIFKNIGNALAAAFAVDKVKDFVQGAVTEFARFEQLVGGVDALFGEAAGKTLQENAAAAFQTAGLSANAYMDTATSFAASLIQALGGDTAAAVDMVDMAVTDMADNANRMGTDIGSIQHAYQGFAKQNYTMLDNLKLGYGGTKAEMARLINDTGILGDTIVELSTMTQKGNFEEVVSFDVVIEAIHKVQEEMNITGTTMEEASGTIEGSINTMKAAWSNWQAGLADPGANMSALTDSLVSSFQTAADNVIPAVQQVGDSLKQVFTDLTGIDLSPVTKVFEELKTSFAEINDVFAEGGLAVGIDTLVQAFERLTGIDLTGLVGGIKSFLDAFFGADGAAIKSVGEAVAAIVGAFDSETVAVVISEAASAIGRFIREVSGAAADVISGIAKAVEWLAKHFNTLLPLITGTATAIGTFIVVVEGMKIISSIPALLSTAGTAITAFKTIFAGLNAVMAANPVGAVVALLAGLATAFATAMATNDAFREGVINMLTMIADVFGEVAGIIMDIPRGLAENFNEMLSVVKDFASKMIRAGQDLVQGLVDGIKSKIASAKEAITSAFGNVTSWVKGVFDINSPSKVFAEIGRNLMRGLAVGVDDEAGIVQDSIDKLRLTVPPITTGKVDFSNSAIGRASAATVNGMFASAGGSSGGAQTINLVVDGRTLAQVVFDPLNGIIKQKGVTLGA